MTRRRNRAPEERIPFREFRLLGERPRPQFHSCWHEASPAVQRGSRVADRRSPVAEHRSHREPEALLPPGFGPARNWEQSREEARRDSVPAPVELLAVAAGEMAACGERTNIAPPANRLAVAALLLRSVERKSGARPASPGSAGGHAFLAWLERTFWLQFHG